MKTLFVKRNIKFECNQCGASFEDVDISMWDYCPCCGAEITEFIVKMKNRKEEE